MLPKKQAIKQVLSKSFYYKNLSQQVAAYANMKKTNDLTDGQWLVYDLGGGTFDVALVKIADGEMKKSLTNKLKINFLVVLILINLL